MSYRCVHCQTDSLGNHEVGCPNHADNAPIRVAVTYMPERIPFVCPVCLGRGTVQAGFYSLSTNVPQWSETCKSCSGEGIVWDKR